MKKILLIITVVLFTACSEEENNCNLINSSNKEGFYSSLEKYESGWLTQDELREQYEIKSKTWVRELKMNGCNKDIITETALDLGFTFIWN